MITSFSKYASKVLFLSFLLGIGLFFSNCSDDEFVPDISDVQVNLDPVRFDQALFQIDTLNTREGLENLEAKHPEFSDLYFTRIMSLKPPWDTSKLYYKVMDGLLKEKEMRGLYDYTQEVYGDLAPELKEIETAFRYYKYYFPQDSLPKLYTFISQFGVAVGVGDGMLLLGLDMFLGQEYKPYSAVPNLYDYLLRSQDKTHLPSKTLAAWIDDKVGSAEGNRFIDEIINNGKKLYILEKLIPGIQDSVLHDFSTQQMEWCQQNEWDMWAHFYGEDILYSNKRLDFRSYVDYGPSSSGMPKESPARTGNWVGYRIVKKYMQNNGGTLQALIDEKDAQKILTLAKYKPSRR